MDAQRAQQLFHLGGGQQVGPGGHRDAAGMVVGQVGAGTAAGHRLPGEFAAVDAHMVGRPLGDQHLPQRQALVVHGHQIAAFLLLGEEEGADILDAVGFGAKRAGAAFALLQLVVLFELAQRGDEPGAGRADALHLAEFLLAGVQHVAVAAEPLQQPVGDGVGVLAGDGEVEQVFQHLMGGQAGQALPADPVLHTGPVVGVEGFFFLFVLFVRRHGVSPSHPCGLRRADFIIYYSQRNGKWRKA